MTIVYNSPAVTTVCLSNLVCRYSIDLFGQPMFKFKLHLCVSRRRGYSGANCNCDTHCCTGHAPNTPQSAGHTHIRFEHRVSRSWDLYNCIHPDRYIGCYSQPAGGKSTHTLRRRSSCHVDDSIGPHHPRACRRSQRSPSHRSNRSRCSRCSFGWCSARSTRTSAIKSACFY